MKKVKKFFSEMEWLIMKYIWKNEKATVREVWDGLFPNREKAYTTVQTYMDRLVLKGILSKKKIGPVNVFKPLITEQAAMKFAAENLVSRAFNGSFGLLATYLIDSRHLSREDLAEIKQLIAQKEKELS